MKEDVFDIKGRNESKIHVYVLEPNSPPKKVLHILHGMGEHASRYKDFAKYLTEHDYAVVMHDHRGHGHSLDDRLEVGILDKSDTHEAMTDDVEYVHNFIMSRYKALPKYMLGHSMGSILLRRYLIKYDPSIKKAVIMGTLPEYGKLKVKSMQFLTVVLSLFKGKSTRCTFLAKLLNDDLIKKIDNPKTKFDWLSYNEENVENYIKDPLSGYAYNKYFYKSFFKMIELVQDKGLIQLTKPIPLLFISGKDDPLNNNNEALELTNTLYSVLDVKSISVEDARHEVLHENNKEMTYESIRLFLDKIEKS